MTDEAGQKLMPYGAGRTPEQGGAAGAPSSCASAASEVGKAASSAVRRSSSACVCSRPSGTARAHTRRHPSEQDMTGLPVPCPPPPHRQALVRVIVCGFRSGWHRSRRHKTC